MKNVTGKSIDKKRRAIRKSIIGVKDTKLKIEKSADYSFLEFNPNPVIEMDLKFNIMYLNPSGKIILSGIQKKLIDHPFLKNIKQIFRDLKNNDKQTVLYSSKTSLKS